MPDENQRQTIATPSQMVDVMLVPRTQVQNPNKPELTVYEQNWLFARQWRAANPSGRLVIEIPFNGALADFEAAVTTAVSKARGKEITLAVGHGGAGGFRGLTQSVFDTIPEVSAEGMNGHKGAMTREVLDFEKIAEKKNGRWVPRPQPRSDNYQDVITQDKVDALSPRYDTLTRVGERLRAGGVSVFRILSCNIGLDPTFGADLQRLLKVTVHMYRGLVAIAEAIWTSPGKPDVTKEQIWITDDENFPLRNRPPSGDPSHDSFHEIPTHREASFP